MDHYFNSQMKPTRCKDATRAADLYLGLMTAICCILFEAEIECDFWFILNMAESQLAVYGAV